jgi:error-prone DNA polymerase
LTPDEFTHLHVASSYSLRYGTASPEDLAGRAAELGMSALALTDRDGLYGAFKHVRACAEAGIRPVLGVDLAVRGAPTGEAGRRTARVTLLAVGRQGWASLCRLVSAAYAQSRDSPAVTPELIGEHAAGLVALLGSASDVGQAIAARRPDLAKRALRRWRHTCETVVEIVDQLELGSTFRAARMAELARDLRVPAVLTNAVRYLDPADSQAAQVLDAARHLVPLGSPRLSPHNGQAYLASAADMAAVAGRVAAAVSGPGSRGAVFRLLGATRELAERCVLDPARDLGIGGTHLPERPGNGSGEHSPGEPGLGELRARCEYALLHGCYRSARNRPPGMSRLRAVRRARNRLRRELNIIAQTGMASYFLTVADVADRIRARGIRCAIRGSGAGSFVNHLLGISAIDPLEHDLIMERFLSADRLTMPDIDLDVESARRLEAYRIIIDAYGQERTACVAMMETYRARSAIRDVAAAMSLPPDEVGAIAKAFPHIRARHITSALTELPELRHSRMSAPQLATVFRLAERLDGLPRHVAMHPCGVLLSDTTLLDRTAVQPSAEGFPLSHLDKDDAEIAGVIKLDVLGVRMQSAMAYALTEIRRTRNETIDLDAIGRDDEPTYAMIAEARTIGCFQIESPGQRELVKKLAPRDVGDLIVDISLFRPGPVNSDMVTPFLRVRHGAEDPRFPHEDLRGVLAETGGVVVFHEQVLRIIDVMTGCGLSEADLVRRTLSDEDGPRRAGPWFRATAQRRGYDPVTIGRVWQVIAAFGGFGFCKAHAAAFAIGVYQSAWLKRHYPAAFYAGVLTHDPGMYPKRVIVRDARLAGVPVLPLDVNASGAGWLVESASSRTESGFSPGIRVSLREVKGISDAEVARIVAGQPYASLRDFWERARVSRPVTERLVLAGAFDSLYAPLVLTRRDLLARIGVLARRAPQARDVPALDLFAGAETSDGMAALVPAGGLRDLDPAERVAAELEILGFEVSRHVLDFYASLLDGVGVVRSDRLDGCRDGQTILVAGVKVATQTPAVRSGQRIIFATLDDAAGLVDLTFFESVQDRCAARLFGSWLLLVRGRVRHAGAGPVAVSLNAAECWDIPALEEIRASRGMDAVRAAMAAGDVTPAGAHALGAVPADPAAGGTGGTRLVIFANGFTLSPYAETGTPGGSLKNRPRTLWHASPGSSGSLVRSWLAPVHRRAQRLQADPVRVPLGDLEERLDERVGQQVRLKAKVDQLGVSHPVVMLGCLHPGVLQVLDRHLAGVGAGDRLGDLGDGQGLGHLVEHAELAAVRRVLAGELNTPDRVPDVDQATGLAARAVHGERVADHRLDHEPVQHRAEHRVVIEPGRQPVVPAGLLGLLAVDHALVQVGGPQVPDPAGELDVVRVVHLGQVVERAGSLGIHDAVPAPVVLDVQPAFLDVDVRRTVLAHRAELDQVDLRVGLRDRVQQVERAQDVVRLGVDRMVAVDHGVGRGALLREVHHRVRAEIADHAVGEYRIDQIADVAADFLASEFPPGRDPRAQRLDRHEAVGAEFVVVMPAREVVGDRDLVAVLRQVQGRRPAEVPVPAQYQDLHRVISLRVTAVSPMALSCPRMRPPVFPGLPRLRSRRVRQRQVISRGNVLLVRVTEAPRGVASLAPPAR